MATGSRPTKLTEEAFDRVMYAVRVGATYKLTAAYANVHITTLNRWRNKGEEAFIKLQSGLDLPDQEALYCDFYMAFQLSVGECAIEWLKKIEKAADAKWQAAAWLLERRFPEEYGRRAVDHNVKLFDVNRWSEKRNERLAAVKAALLADGTAGAFSLDPGSAVPLALSELIEENEAVVDAEYTTVESA